MRYKLTLLAAIPFLYCVGLVAPHNMSWMGPAAAREEHDEDGARIALENGEVLPLERIIAGLANTIPGEISGLELEKENGIWIYEFKVISPDGRMLKAHVDAKTGKLIKITER
jgi:uncharacterized membrane protein YkoI